MTSSIRDIAYQLRQGQLIALADETGWSVAADPTSDAAVDKLLTLAPLMPTGVRPTVLIQDTNQLVMYAGQMPDISYDLVDFSEIPLTVIFDQGKSVSMRVWAQGEQTTEPATNSPIANSTIGTAGELAIRRSLNPDIQRLIGGFGRGLLTIPLESLVLPPTAKAIVSEQYGSLPGMPKKPRIMRLKANGEVSFIRK